MRIIILICLICITSSGLFCAAGPLGRFTSKNIKIKPAPKNADLPTLVAHYETQSKAHQEKSTQWYRTAGNKQAHRVAAQGHSESKKLILKENEIKNEHPARYRR